MHLQSEIIDSVDLKSGALYDTHCPGCGAVIMKHGLTKWEKPLGEVFDGGDSAWGSSMGEAHFPQRFYGGQDWGQCPGCEAALYWFSLRIVTADKPASLHHLDECMLCNVEMPVQCIEQVALREGDPGRPASWLLTTATSDCCLFVEHKFGPFLRVEAGRPFASKNHEIENALKRVWEQLHWVDSDRHICESLDLLAPTLLADAADRAALAGRSALTNGGAAAAPNFPATGSSTKGSGEEPVEREPEAVSASPSGVAAASPLAVDHDSPATLIVDDFWGPGDMGKRSEDTPESQAEWSAAVARLRPLMDAVVANDCEAVKHLLARDGPGLRDAARVRSQHGRRSNRDGDDITPLMMCAASGRLELVKELVKVYGPHWVLGWSSAAWFMAAEHTPALGMNALMFACAGGQPSVVSWLLNEFGSEAARLSLATAIDKKGRTALMHAALGGDPECVELLIPWSQPERQCRSGRTALMHAARSGREAAVRALIPVSDVAAIGERKDSAVSCAAASGDAGTMRALLELPGVRPADAYSRGRTPLMLAAETPSVELIELLLPFSDPAAECDEGMTALMHAAACGNETAVRALLPFSDVAKIGRHGWSAVLCAVRTGCAPTMKALLEAPGIRPDDFPAPHGTPLILAAQGDSVELVELLLPLSNPNAQSDDGMTALMHGVRPCGSPEIIKALLRHCDPKWANADGFTALMHAAYSCDPDTVALLLPESDVCARSSPARKKARKERVSRCDIRSFRNATALTIAAQMLTRRAKVGHVSEELGTATLRILAEQMKPCDIDPEFALLVGAKEYVAAEALSEFTTDQAVGEALASAFARGKKHARVASLMPRAFVRYEQFALRRAVVRGEVGAPSETTLPDSELPSPIRADSPAPAPRARRL